MLLHQPSTAAKNYPLRNPPKLQWRVTAADIADVTATAAEVNRVYYQKRLDAKDTRAMALRALKRRVGRAVYGHLREDHRCRHAAMGGPASK